MSRVSYQYDSILDDEFKNILLPLNLMQSIILQQKYRITGGFIAPVGFGSHLIRFIGAAFLIYVHYCWWLGQDRFIVLPDLVRFMKNNVLFDAVFYNVSLVVVLTVGVRQSRNHVRLIVTIQKVHRAIGLNDNLQTYRRGNWFYSGILLAYYFTFIIFSLTSSVSNIYHLIIVSSLLCFDVNVLYATRIITLLVYEVNQWMVELDNFFVLCTKPNHTRLRRLLFEVSLRENKLFRVYFKILEAYKLCGSLFRVTILLLAAELSIHPLIYIQALIELSKSTNILNEFTLASAFTGFAIIVWLLKNLVLLSCVCAASQQFCRATTDVDAACAVILGKEVCLVNVRRLCKKVCRLNATAREVNGRGALTAHAALPLRLLALLASYTVVLLQFAFL